ncbi:MAG: DUF3147 family protein [Candidatus Cloacimonetes bacterium]|nr:DUF3147 family protein [Candidatus Cloacimonadota bacterium]
MDQTFLLKLLLSFFIGGIWITFATIIAERFGSKLGGVIAGIPSTIIISLFFIGWTQSPIIASKATTVVPIIMGIDALFVVVYALLRNRQFYIAIACALIFWAVSSFILALVGFDSFLISLIGFVVLVVLSYYILEKRYSFPSESPKYTKYTLPLLAIRGILSGSIIAFAVLMAKIAGPLVGGMFSAFPAVMLSTMIITYYSHGTNFSLAVLKIITVSGPINVVAYAIAVRYLYGSVGLFWGTVLSFIVSLISSFLVYQFVKRKMI